jgi:hypothetical protein
VAEEAKIRYLTRDGRYSKAYVVIEDDVATGFNKYTDELVSARWIDDEGEWQE